MRVNSMAPRLIAWVSALMALLMAAGAWAQTTPESAPETAAPPKAKRVPWVPPGPPLPPEELLKSLSDPGAIARYYDAFPEKFLDPKMPSELRLTLARVLLEAERTFEAERLLYEAWKASPTDLVICRAYGRVLVSLGRVDSALKVLQGAKAEHQYDAELRYLLGTAWLGHRPRGPADLQQALAEWQAVLEINPDFTATDGTRASQIQAAVERLKSDLAGGPR